MDKTETWIVPLKHVLLRDHRNLACNHESTPGCRDPLGLRTKLYYASLKWASSNKITDYYPDLPDTAHLVLQFEKEVCHSDKDAKAFAEDVWTLTLEGHHSSPDDPFPFIQ